MTEGKRNQKQVDFEVKTFPVPFALGEIKESITINTNTNYQLSKEEIVDKAFKFHSQGNISEASKYYQYFIAQGFKDYRVFSNYGTILKSYGKLKEAELSYRKSIELKPDFADAHFNLSNVLNDLGRLEEAEFSQKKVIELQPEYAQAHNNLGYILRALGKLKEAELSTRRAIEFNPDSSISYYNLGAILIDLGELHEAETSTRKAIELNHDFSMSHYNLGIILKALDNFNEAEISTRKAIELNPNFPDAYNHLGNILKKLGKSKDALISLKKAIELNPDFAQAHLNLGIIFKDLGKLQKAELSTRKAIALNPNLKEAHNNLGNILRKLGKSQEALLSQKKAIELNPDFAIYHYNLGAILKDLGKLEEAEISTRKAIELKPDLVDAHNSLGFVLRDLGRLQEAENSQRKGITLNPNCVEAYLNLGNILRDLGKSEEAEKNYRKSIELNPNFVIAQSNLGTILKDRGDFEEARSCYKKCLELDQNDLSFNIQAKLFISHIPLTKLQIEQEREEINRQISLIGNNKNITFKNDRLPNSIDFIYYLAYHNYDNDKEILVNIANNLSKKDGILNKSFDIDQRIKESQARKKIRLGICSSFLYSHSVTRCFLNIIEDLAKTGIEIILFRGQSDKVDKTTDHIISLATETITLPDSLERSCQIVLNSSIDILLYLDIGMSVKTYFMCLSRLALVQVLHAGHPQTSGSQNMDYYITSNRKEIKDSDKFFSERIIRMTRLPVNYSLPKILNSTFKVSDLNISEDDFIIGLPHTLFKYHPDFDEILDKVLDEIPHARLLFFEGLKECNTKTLLSRWEKNSKSILKRTIICPRVKFDDYLTISKRFDIVLDTIYFGMGNTFFQAMALGIPVVTLLPNQPRGGGVSAGYKQMGILNPPIAKSRKEYISICKKLAFDKSYRENISNQILLNSKDHLFNDKTIYKEHIEFFEKALEAAYKKELLPKNWEPFQ